jgi:4-amino-4-deoxy-L-arabinose transferase-like glycosyltransferase
MNQTPTTAGDADMQRRRDLFFPSMAWGFLIVITLYVSYFSHLGAFGFIGPDEPRYAWIARDMAESGDWVTPRLYGRPWFEKPVLYYWAAAISFKLFGVSETTARLPAGLFALMATLALSWLALRLDGWESARRVLLLIPTAVGMIGFSHAAAPDMPFAAMLAVAMVCAAVTLRLVSWGRGVSVKELVVAKEVNGDEVIVGEAGTEEFARNSKVSRSIALVLFGFFLGAAVLAKGPAALILAGAATFLWAAFTGRWREASHLLHPAAVAAFLLTSLPWYVLCARRNPEFFRVFIIEHNFRRYLTPEFQHLQPIWFYIPITLIALLPWTVWLGWYALRETRASLSEAPRLLLLFVAAWAIFPVVFFSLSKSKLPGYILPAIPPLVFLIAAAVKQSIRSQQHFSRYALGAPGLFFVASACWAAFSKTKGSLVVVFVVFAVLGGLVVVFLAVKRRAHAALVASVIGLLLLLSVVYVSISKLDAQLSAREAAAQIGVARAAGTYAFKLQRSSQYQLNFYLHREIPEWSPALIGDAIVVTNEKHLEELRNIAQIVAVISDASPQAEIIAVRPLPLP